MSLRDEAITHMAAKVCVEPTTCFPHLEEATMSLTALLDFLGAHTEEWAKALPEIFLEQQPDRLIDTPQGKVPNLLGPGSVTNVRIVRYLIAALRGTTEEE